MAVFSSVIFKGVIVGGFSLATAGLLFTGTQQLEDASNYVRETTAKITQYEVSENSLLQKLGGVKNDANEKISQANGVITSKNGEIERQLAEINALSETKTQLESDIAGLQTDIANLNASLTEANTNLEATRSALAEKTAAFDAKVAELRVANDKIAEYVRLAQIAYDKAREADAHVTQLETEVQKANAEVAAHDAVVDQAKVDTDGLDAMTNEELDAVDTTTEDVVEEEVPAAE
jgi:chromosome segregation ATPase